MEILKTYYPLKMMNSFKNDEFQVMRELLVDWNLSELCEHLQAEGINIAELQQMKPHHVMELLQNYKLGVRIRFEHNFESWRLKMNKPLMLQCRTHCLLHYDQCMWCKSSDTSTEVPVPVPFSVPVKSQWTRATNTDVIKFSNAETNTSPSLLPPYLLMHEMSKLIPQSTHQAMEEQQDPEVKATPHILTSTPPHLHPISQLQIEAPRSLQLPNNIVHAPLSVMTILKSAGAKGASILQHYEQHRALTSTHRALLISIIVHFFDENDLHLSLTMSHHMEAQILRMFPTEKLEQYRTEKRGKMYVKFCNMKRYRRDKPSIIKHKWAVPTTQVRYESRDEESMEPTGDEDEFLNIDNCPQEQMQIKSEQFAEDDFQ